MKKTTFLLRMFALVSAMSCALGAGAYDFESAGLYFNITGDNTVELTYKNTYFNSYRDNVIIPSTVTNGGKTYTVTSIGVSAFQQCTALTGVTIPNTVTLIESSSFFGCSELTEVTIPNSITLIDGIAFSGCTNLRTVVLGENCRFRGPNFWSVNIFYNCPNLTSVTCLSNEPWAYQEPMFDQAAYDNAVLYVPPHTVEGYRATNYWYHFSSIEKIPHNTIRGDVNDDGNVSIRDVTALINYLLSNNSSGISLSAADVNRDGRVSITDVTTLINYLLSGVWPNTNETFTVNGVSFDMVEVDGGTFMMGSDDDDYDAGPVHQVTLSTYFIGETEVTQELWLAVMGNNPSGHSPSNGYDEDLKRPVEGVYYTDCQDFIAELNKLTGKSFRLLTEAEWEFAARGGNKSQGYQHSGSDDLDAVAWHYDNADWMTHAVATKAPNELGIYDMDGNVSEWVRDLYGPYSSEPQVDPVGVKINYDFVVRGSSVYDYGYPLYYRDYSYGSSTNYVRGLRLAMDADDSPKFRLSPSVLMMEQGHTATVNILNGSGDYTITSRYGSATGTANSDVLTVTGVGESSDEMLFVTDNATGATAILNLHITENMTMTYTVNGVTFNMKKVKSGTFMMGAADDDAQALDNEKPAHEVSLNDYALSETEVTQELWQAVMGRNPSKFSSLNGYSDDLSRPVECVTWNECQKFISRLNQLTGEKFRMPTEAEWEFAARGGNKSKGYKYAGSNQLSDVGWYNIPSGIVGTHPVASKAPNELGIYDMSGNVSEWVLDWSGPYSSIYQRFPTGPVSGTKRVYRGGGWDHDYADSCRVTARFDQWGAWYYYSQATGLRLALDIGSYNYTLRFSEPIVEVREGESKTVTITNYSYSGNYSITGGTDCVNSTLNGNRLTVTGISTGVTTVHLTNSSNNTNAILTVIVKRPAHEDIYVNGVGFTMMTVDGGTFMMGASDDDPDASDIERPAHWVTLSDYYIGQTEVTLKLWQAVMGSIPSYVNYSDYNGNLNYPMMSADWIECQKFVDRLNGLTGMNFRLPSEAEWEFAARGGNLSHGYKYAGSNNLSDVCELEYDEIEGEYNEVIVPVISKLPNELNIYGMSGNVDELCQDYFARYSSVPRINPVGPTATDQSNNPVFVYRGGRVVSRTDIWPDLTYRGLGFRLALDPYDTDRFRLSKSVIILDEGESETVNIENSYHGMVDVSVTVAKVKNQGCVSCTLNDYRLTVTGTAPGVSNVFVTDNRNGAQTVLTVVVNQTTQGEYAYQLGDPSLPATEGQATNDHLFVRMNTSDYSCDNTLILDSTEPQLVWIWLDDDEIYQNQAVQALTPIAYSTNGSLYNEITYNGLQCSIYLPEGVDMATVDNEDGDDVYYTHGGRLPNHSSIGAAYSGTVTVDGKTYKNYSFIIYSGDTYGSHFSSRTPAAYGNNGALMKDDAALFGIYIKLTDTSLPRNIGKMIIANTEFSIMEALRAGWPINEARFFHGSGGNNQSQRFQKYVRVKISRY